MTKNKEQPMLIPASSGESMLPFIEWLKTYSTLIPHNVFEIGANMGQDADAIRRGFGLQDEDVWTFEPHPRLDEYIRGRYKFHQFPYAVSNTETDELVMNVINFEKNSNSGISSARKHLNVPEGDFTQIPVKCVRMDNFMADHNIQSIDFLKLDVEGLNYEVLQGFGGRIVDVQALHIESEHEESWEGEALWGDIRRIIEPHFELVFFQRYYSQSDSFWVQKKYLRRDP